MSSILHDLGIEPGALLINIIGFLVLLWLMRRYLFGPVGAFIDQRKRLIADELDSAEADREKAAQERNAIEARRTEIMQAVHEKAEQTKDEARQEAGDITKAAREQAREMERSARAATERDQREAALELRDQVSDVAAQMARSVLRQALDEERQKALFDAFITDVERLAADRQSSQ